MDRHALGAASKARGNSPVTLAGKEFIPLSFDDIKGTCYGFVYITENRANGMLYLGIHSNWDKKYLGSGTYLKSAVKEYGRDSFYRYIIDTAENQRDLEQLEADYIQDYFGFDIALSPMFYNITSGLQRGGNNFAGMSERDRSKRCENISAALIAHEKNMTSEEKAERSKLHHDIAVKAYKEHPDYRKNVSEGTKRGMTEEVRKHISEVQRGGQRPFKTSKSLKEAQERMSKVGKSNKGKHPWNYGRPASEHEATLITDHMRLWYRVYINDTVLISKLSNTGGHLEMAKKVGESLNVDTAGRNVVTELIKTGGYYEHKVSSKAFMDGLHFELIGKGLDCHS